MASFCSRKSRYYHPSVSGVQVCHHVGEEEEIRAHLEIVAKGPVAQHLEAAGHEIRCFRFVSNVGQRRVKEYLFLTRLKLELGRKHLIHAQSVVVGVLADIVEIWRWYSRQSLFRRFHTPWIVYRDIETLAIVLSACSNALLAVDGALEFAEIRVGVCYAEENRFVLTTAQKSSV